MCAGDDPQGNGHVESEVLQIKRRVRLHLHEAGLEVKHWPSALRYSVEERCRSQLSALGVPSLPMIPFFRSVAVKRKRWHNRGALAPPFVEGHLPCPSPVMQHGWVVLLKDLQVVHVREALVPAPLGDQAAITLQEDAVQPPPVPMNEEDRPPYRLVGKQPMPVRHATPPDPKITFPHGRYDDMDASSPKVDDDGYSPSLAPKPDPVDLLDVEGLDGDGSGEEGCVERPSGTDGGEDPFPDPFPLDCRQPHLSALGQGGSLGREASQSWFRKIRCLG